MEEENHIPKEAFITDSSWRVKIRDNKNKMKEDIPRVKNYTSDSEFDWTSTIISGTGDPKNSPIRKLSRSDSVDAEEHLKKSLSSSWGDDVSKVIEKIDEVSSLVEVDEIRKPERKEFFKRYEGEEPSIFKRFPFTKKNVKGENNKYIRKLEDGVKLNPIMNIECEEAGDPEGEGPYTCDIVFSFDTTGSMASVIDSIRKNLSETIEKLFTDIPGIRIGIIVHGDYCDFPNMLWKLDLNRNIHIINDFINGVPNTSGGDYPECYELVLKTAYDFNWKSDVKVLVVIGDAEPHKYGEIISYRNEMIGFQERLNIDWKAEVEKLKDKKVTIFSCHALPERNKQAISFYHHISSETDGYYFCLDDLQSFKEYMIAICLKAADGAENIELLKQRQEELKQEIEKYNREKEELGSGARRPEEKISKEVAEELEKSRKEYFEELENVKEAINDSNQTNIFASERADSVIKSIRKNKNMKSRVESYQESFSNEFEPGEKSLLNRYNAPQKPERLRSFMRTISTPNKVFSKVKRDWTCIKCNQININLRAYCIKCNEKNEELFEIE